MEITRLDDRKHMEHITLRLPKRLVYDLKEKSKRQGKTFSELIREFLLDSLSKK